MTGVQTCALPISVAFKSVVSQTQPSEGAPVQVELLFDIAGKPLSFKVIAGGVAGPDLTQLGTRFSAKDMLESIIEPSKTISDQYAATIFELKSGSSVVGRMINQDKDKYYVSQNPFAQQSVREISKTDVVRTQLSPMSVMLPGMLYRLNPEEVKDLIAYLMAGGNKDHPIYKKK